MALTDGTFRDKHGYRVQVGEEVMVKTGRGKPPVRCYVAQVATLGGVPQAMVQQHGRNKRPFWAESKDVASILETPKILDGTLADWQ